MSDLEFENLKYKTITRFKNVIWHDLEKFIKKIYFKHDIFNSQLFYEDFKDDLIFKNYNEFIDLVLNYELFEPEDLMGWFMIYDNGRTVPLNGEYKVDEIRDYVYNKIDEYRDYQNELNIINQ